MARTLRSGLALLLAAAFAVTVIGRLTHGTGTQAHSHDHHHHLASGTQIPLPNDPAGDAGIELLLEGRATQADTDAVKTAFDLSALTQRQRNWAISVLGGGCAYDWNKVIPSLAGRKVKIQLGNPPARAMYYPAGLRVVIHRYFYKSKRAQASRLLGWEVAHAVDLLTLNDEQRSRISGYYHQDSSDDHGWLHGEYEQQVGEAFMEGFVAAFCPVLSTTPMFDHETNTEIAEGIRTELS